MLFEYPLPLSLSSLALIFQDIPRSFHFQQPHACQLSLALSFKLSPSRSILLFLPLPVRFPLNQALFLIFFSSFTFHGAQESPFLPGFLQNLDEISCGCRWQPPGDRGTRKDTDDEGRGDGDGETHAMSRRHFEHFDCPVLF